MLPCRLRPFRSLFFDASRFSRLWIRHSSEVATSNTSQSRQKFQPLDIGLRKRSLRQRQRRQRPSRAAGPPRCDRMPVDQHWPSVWPAPRSFQPASVPLPLRQSYVDKPLTNVTIGKYANLELMKVTNFLHLTPPAIKQHCDALRRFCTEWPEGLDEEKMERLLPVEVITQDFVHDSPSIRHPEARVVKLSVPLRSLQLNPVQRDKFLRLTHSHYDERTDRITLTASQCPYRRQNYQHAVFLLTACRGESVRQQPWEQLKSRVDHESFVWQGSSSEQACRQLNIQPDSCQEKDYARCVSTLLEKGETEQSLAEYRAAVMKMLNLNTAS